MAATERPLAVLAPLLFTHELNEVTDARVVGKRRQGGQTDGRHVPCAALV